MLLKRWIGVLGLGLGIGLSGAWPAIAADAPTAVKPPAEQSAAYAHLMRAVLAARRGDFGAASAEIERALDAVPDSPELLVEAAELLSWTGRAQQAERLARRALELDPAQPRALRFLGDFQLARALANAEDVESRDEALQLFERLAAGDGPVDPEVLTRILQLRHRAGNLAGALEVARQVVALRPGDSTAARTLAQLLLQQGEEREALGVLLAHLATHAAAEDLALFAEQLAHNLEGWETVALILAPKEPFPLEARVTWRLLGEAYLRLDRMPDAARALERAREAGPEDLRVRNHLALAYRSVGRGADAAELLAELVRESPEFPSFRQLLAETLEFQGDASGALAAYSAALESWAATADAAPVRDAIRQRMALLYNGLDDPAAAETMLDQVENTEDILTVRIRGRCAIQARKWDEARRAVRRLRVQGEDGLAALLEGEVLARQGRWSKAAPKFEEAIARLGPDLRRRIAEIYRTEGRPEEGRSLLAGWVQADPENADARFLFGEYLYLIDRFEDAEPELRESFRLNPRHAPALNFLGYSYAERNTRLDEALDLIQRALEIDAWSGAYLDSLGWTYYQMGRYTDARGPLERAAREMPKDATILEHLGDVYLSLDDTDAAVAAWRRALAAGAADPQALRGKISTTAGDESDAVATEDEGGAAPRSADTSSLIPPP